jgi:hypothetical protein
MTPIERGFLALIRTNGETLTFRLAAIRALVNRLPERGQPKGMQDAGTEDGSVIQIANTFTEPKRGEIFTDSKSFSHRVEKTKFLGHCWNCECEVTR